MPSLRIRTHPAVVERVLVASIISVSIVAMVWLGRHLTFYHDELSFFIELQPASPVDYLRQWNSHWLTSVYAVFMGLDALFGHRFYLPYMVTLHLLHGVAAAALFALVRPNSTRANAIALMLVLLWLGSAAENLYWAWQIGFVGAAAVGLVAMVALVHGRDPLAAALLLVAVTFSGMGLPFVAAAGVYVLATRPRSVVWIGIPLAAFAAWRVLFAPQDPDVTTTQVTPYSIASYAVGWTIDALGKVSGLGLPGGIALAGLATLAVLGRRASPLALAALAGLAAEFLIVALARSGAPYYVRERYVYVAAAFALIAAGELLVHVRRPTLRLVIVTFLVIAIGTNGVKVVLGPYRWGDARYHLPTAFGCIDRAVIPDGEGPRFIPPEGRCPM